MASYWKYVIDLLYLVVATIVIVIFTKRGFVRALFRSGRLIFAGLICYFAAPGVSDLLYDHWIYKGIFSWVFVRVEAFLYNASNAVNFDGMLDALPGIVKNLVDVEALRESYHLSEGDLLEMANEFSATAAEPLSMLLSKILAYAIVFVAALVLLFILFKILDAIFKLPVLSTINRVLGFVFGVVTALLALSAATYLAGLAIGMLGSPDMLESLINSSFCFRLFNRMVSTSLL